MHTFPADYRISINFLGNVYISWFHIFRWHKYYICLKIFRSAVAVHKVNERTKWRCRASTNFGHNARVYRNSSTACNGDIGFRFEFIEIASAVSKRSSGDIKKLYRQFIDIVGFSAFPLLRDYYRNLECLFYYSFVIILLLYKGSSDVILLTKFFSCEQFSASQTAGFIDWQWLNIS